MTDVDTGVRIKQKASELFMQYGLRSVSMDDIANSLGMSKKTIYQYYEDKDELVLAVFSEQICQNQSVCEKDRTASIDPIHEIFLAMAMVVEMFNSMNSSLIFDMQKYHPNTFLKFQQHKNDYLYNVIKDNIERGIKEGLYREDIDVDILAKYRVESMMLPFNPEFHNKLKHSLSQIQQELIIHFVFGLVTLKGYKLIIKYQQAFIK